MQGCIAGAALLLCLLSATASAQDGLRSASLPERPASTASPPRDVFRVDPGFYERLHERNPAPYWYSEPIFYQVFYPVFYPVQYGAAPIPTKASREAGREGPPSVDQRRTTLPPSLPGVPKTFYLIAGC